MSETYLSRTQAARRCNRCPRTMRNLQARGLGPRVIMIGSRAAYPVSSLESWLAQGGDR